jgi:hypothetical protein
MLLGEILSLLAPVSRRLTLMVCLSLLLSTLAAEGRSVAPLEASYIPALAVADHFLQAWQSGDVESGMVLLTSHAKESAAPEVVKGFFSSAGPSAYEIGRGKALKRGRYEFPVVLVGGAGKNVHAHRRFATIVVVNTGNNDWAVDKLP